MRYLLLGAIALFILRCTNKNKEQALAMPPQSLPVVSLTSGSAVTYLEYPATVEGTQNIEIRPQVSGYLEKIYVEEGAFVRKGQLLFKINDHEYTERATQARASTSLARAAVEKAKVEVDRLQPLVDNKVIAEVQLKTARANYDAAKASLDQALSATNSANITVGYTLIKAPVDGFIGRIPYKTGSLIGKGEAVPLTVVSEVNNVYAYFSMAESDFLAFTAKAAGSTLQEKLQHVPAIELKLPDNTIYAAKGKLELVEGQFDRAAGTISFRAIFPNDHDLLRSGITGKIRIPSQHNNQLLVPQESTYELQDKIFVFALTDSNKVVSKMLSVEGKAGNYYLVNKGIQNGETIVYSGLQRLRDGAVINPSRISFDSLLKANPL
jgi:membrane fusion protein (multidrug efflux system)